MTQREPKTGLYLSQLSTGSRTDFFVTQRRHFTFRDDHQRLDKGQTSLTQPKEQENRTDRLRSLFCGYQKSGQGLPGPVACLIKDERPGPDNQGRTTGDKQPTEGTTHTMLVKEDNTRPVASARTTTSHTRRLAYVCGSIGSRETINSEPYPPHRAQQRQTVEPIGPEHLPLLLHSGENPIRIDL
jgi:hypothetical protein